MSQAKYSSQTGRIYPLVPWLFCASGLLGSFGTAAQEVYRIVGADGRVTFSDRPPVSQSAQSTSMGKLAASATDDQALLPLLVRQAVAKFPVTLYTSKRCAPCDAGRNLLMGRGVPFVEKTVNTTQDVEALQNLGGGTSLPFLTIGAQHITGFQVSEWTQYLNAATYPERSSLPATYRRGIATPLVPEEKLVQPAAGATTTPQSNPATAPNTPRPLVNPNNPAGIQF